MSWINSQVINNAGKAVTQGKLKAGNNWQLNIGKGENPFNAAGLVTVGIGALGDLTTSLSNKYLNTGDSYKDTLLKGIYGDSSQGNFMLIIDNISGNSTDKALLTINNGIYTDTGVSSNLAISDSFKNLKNPVELEKRNFWQTSGNILGSTLKGISSGAGTGSIIPGVGNIVGGIGGGVLGLLGGIGSSINGNKFEKIQNALEIAYNKSLDNLSLQALQTLKQNNINALANMYALGGLLNYNIDDKYLANDYMSKLNNRIYKPLFDSMNYFAMGGSPDFTEFNTGGTHEENPLGGIPLGLDKQGIMNTVELGETKTSTPNGEYIFSDRLKLSNEECKNLKIPKGSTYAEASKILRKEYDENPNDEIARRGWELFRDILIQFLEVLKQEIALKESRTQELSSTKIQGINPNILNTFDGIIKKFKDGGISESFKYAPIAGNLIGLSQNIFTPEDYSLPNRLQQEIKALPRVSVPKNTNYMTYNPVDVNRYTNQYNANAAAQRSAIMNTSNPNRNAALAAAVYNANIGYGDLVQAIEAQNAKEKQAVQQFNAGIDQLNIANQLQADGINQQYEQMRISGIMQELAMRDAIQTARANAIQGNLKGLTDNLSGIAQLAQNDRWFDVYMAGLPHKLTMLQRLANGEDINDLIMEFTPGYLDNERTEFIDNLKKNPRYKDYISQITIK